MRKTWLLLGLLACAPAYATEADLFVQNAAGQWVPASAAVSIPSATTPGSLTITALDVASVTTGGTAVNALSAGHASKGGFLITANAAGICVNVRGTAGTATSGDTICVVANQSYTIPPTTNAISVNSSASTVTLAGNGLN